MAVPAAGSKLSFIPKEESWQCIPASSVAALILISGSHSGFTWLDCKMLCRLCLVKDHGLLAKYKTSPWGKRGPDRFVISGPSFPSWTCSLPISLPLPAPPFLARCSSAHLPFLYYTYLPYGNDLINPFTQTCLTETGYISM